LIILTGRGATPVRTNLFDWEPAYEHILPKAEKPAGDSSAAENSDVTASDASEDEEEKAARLQAEKEKVVKGLPDSPILMDVQKADLKDAYSHQVSFSLTWDVTKRLMTRCKERGITVGAAQGIAFARALWPIIRDNAPSTTIQFPVDLRRWLPAKFRQQVGCLIWLVDYPVEFAKICQGDVWKGVAEWSDSFKAEVLTRNWAAPVAAPAAMMKDVISEQLKLLKTSDWHGHSYNTGISNLGLVNMPEEAEEFWFTACRRYIGPCGYTSITTLKNRGMFFVMEAAKPYLGIGSIQQLCGRMKRELQLMADSEQCFDAEAPQSCVPPNAGCCIQ